jgi:hypothetical protein
MEFAVNMPVLVDLAARRRGDRGDQVGRSLRDTAHDDGLAGLHRAAGDEHDRDVQPHRGVEHARGDLVAVGDADERVGLVRVDHVLDGVGDDLARGQRVEHAAMTHGDAVVDCDGVELTRHAARGANCLGHDLADVFQVHVARHELGVGVRDGDDRLAEVGVGHTGGAPECAGACGIAADGGGS